MLEATISGRLVTHVKSDSAGNWYCTVYSDQARRSVRVLIRNAVQAEMIDSLAKHARLTATGLLETWGAIGNSGQALALLAIKANQIKIHEALA